MSSKKKKQLTRGASSKKSKKLESNSQKIKKEKRKKISIKNDLKVKTSNAAKSIRKHLTFNQTKKTQPYKTVKIMSHQSPQKHAKKDSVKKEAKAHNPPVKMNISKLNAMLIAKEDSSSSSQEKSKKTFSSLTLRERMLTQLKASRFRFLNEHMYNNESSITRKFFEDDPQAFYAYHEGYKQQVERWPVNPVDVIIESIKKLPQDFVIADLGCGEAKIAESVPHTVHSFDLVAVNEKVKACDMAHTPLLTGRVNVVVFCLSLMGSNLKDYLLEANRILAKNGILKVAEVESRFHQIEDFIKTMSQYGFENTWKDLSNNLFYFMDFKKVKDILKASANKLPDLTLKPCMYKKR